jgi:hypothetical protein
LGKSEKKMDFLENRLANNEVVGIILTRG